MQILGATDVGSRRQNNEDSYRFGVGPDYGWAVVCDGVGGANGGEIASKIVAESIEKSLKSSIRSGIPTRTIVDIIEVGISRSYILLLDEAKGNDNLSNMATTAAGVVVSGEEAVVYWAGDSRVYLLRGDKLIQLTKDHTVVAQMVASGAITPEEAENHPKRNYITNCVDAKASATVEYLFDNLEAGDWLLICSDGVNDYIPSADLPGIVAEAVVKGDPQVIISAALNGGGGDNITAVLMQYEGR